MIQSVGLESWGPGGVLYNLFSVYKTYPFVTIGSVTYSYFSPGKISPRNENKFHPNKKKKSRMS